MLKLLKRPSWFQVLKNLKKQLFLRDFFWKATPNIYGSVSMNTFGIILKLAANVIVFGLLPTDYTVTDVLLAVVSFK